MHRYLPLVLILFVMGMAACQNAETADHDQPAPRAVAAEETAMVGTVVETMDSGGYTYAQVLTGEETVWAAGPISEIETGQMVEISTGMLMRNFRSESLDRTFEQIYFVASFGSEASSGDAGMPEGHPDIGSTQGEAAIAEAHGNVAVGEVEMDYSGLSKPDGGYTVAELWDGKAQLAGKEVAVRGKVVKYLSGIMGKNWIHVRDGSGAEGTNDLTVTTDVSAKTGDTVLVRGKVSVDRDFGSGYRYGLIIEDAKVDVE